MTTILKDFSQFSIVVQILSGSTSMMEEGQYHVFQNFQVLIGQMLIVL